MASAAQKWLVKIAFKLCISVPTVVFMSSNGRILCWGYKETESVDRTNWAINFVPQDMRFACAYVCLYDAIFNEPHTVSLSPLVLGQSSDDSTWCRKTSSGFFPLHSN